MKTEINKKIRHRRLAVYRMQRDFSNLSGCLFDHECGRRAL
mgnify:FL=1